MKGVVNMTKRIEDLLERLVVLEEMKVAVRYTSLAVKNGEIEPNTKDEVIAKILDRYGEIFEHAIMETLNKKNGA